jgi:D-alanyl-D-alanine carboxypeptidase/D-alanyl-D-alanine-endopeptidase (penicillin-binding protein 4)
VFRSSVRRLILLAVLPAVLLPAPAALAAPLDTTTARLARAMRDAGPSSGALVRDLDSGTTLLSVHADDTRAPASVEKLYTTSATLLRDGPAGTIPTVVRAAAAPVDGVVAGPLFLVGNGDPTLDDAGIAALAAAVHPAGVTRVLGGVRGDASAWDARVGGPDSGFGYDSDLGGLLSPLAVARGRDGVRLQRTPATSAAARFLRALRTAGVTVQGAVGQAPAPLDSVEITRRVSPPFGALIAATNVPSDNYLAEMLLKGLGARHGTAGTTAAGAAAARAALDDLGVHPRIVDGSGLSRSDRTTPRQVVRLLQGMARRSVGPAFTASLPVAGSTGTLADRMRGTVAAGRCRAKTGTLRYTTALAGYCTSGDGGTVAFAVLMNGVNVTTGRRIQDRIATAIAGWDGLGAGPAQTPPQGGVTPAT